MAAALGAARGSLHALVLQQGLRYALGSIVVDLPGDARGRSLIRGVLYGVQPHDVVTVAALCVAVVAITLLAASVPAVRAGRFAPAAVLRA